MVLAVFRGALRAVLPLACHGLIQIDRFDTCGFRGDLMFLNQVLIASRAALLITEWPKMLNVDKAVHTSLL